VFHAQYGKFIQFPSLSTSYRGIASTSGILRGGNFFTNTTGYGLRPERTTSYEIGFAQQLSDNSSLDVTAFYKDILDQIQYQQILPTAGATNQAFPMFVNGDFGTTKGLEVKFTMRRVERAQLSINYTLSDARGTGSSPTTLAGTAVTGVVGYLPKFIFPVEFNQVHHGNISFDYRFARGDGGPILEQLGLNVFANFNSGTSFTKIVNQNQSDADPRNRVPAEEVGASTTPWFFQLDFRLDKSFQLDQINANVYVYVQNILGTNNVVTVFRKTGSGTDDGWLGTAQGQADVAHYGTDADTYTQMYRALNLGLNSGAFGPPRQIRFGVKLEY
jgi:outer membrane receptor protein involved in Fe transport